MIKSSFLLRPLALGFLCLSLFTGCGKTFTGQSVSGERLVSSLNPISKGEKLNPISKGEQLNPGSKGERNLSGFITLLGSNRYLPPHQLQFYLDGQPLPSDWVQLQQASDNTLSFQLQHIPTAGIHLLSARYYDQQLESMLPPETTQLNLNLHSSFVVDVVQFANAHRIRTLEQWTPDLLNTLISHDGLKQLLQQFENSHPQATPQALHPWIEEDDTTQMQLRQALESLQPE